jgi:hypothetical protein
MSHEIRTFIGELRLLLPCPQDLLIFFLTFVRESTTLEIKGEQMKTVTQIKREKEKMEQRLYDAALALIEDRARKILVAHPSLDEFVMAMGGWLFSKKNSDDNISDVYGERIPAYARAFCGMMDEFDDMELKVTGEPMRFTAQGPVVRMWGICDGLDGKAVAAKYLEVA